MNLNRTFGVAQAREVAQRLGLPEEAWRSIPAPLAASTDGDRRGYRVVQAGRDQCPSVPIKASTMEASKMPSNQASSWAIEAASMRCSAQAGMVSKRHLIGVIVNQQRGEHRHVRIVRFPHQPVRQDPAQDDLEQGCRGAIRSPGIDGDIRLAQKDSDAHDIALRMLFAIKPNLGQEIVPSLVRPLTLKFDHVDRARMG